MSKHRGKAQIDACSHKSAICINPYELIRKYRCSACGAVMMCMCDEAFGQRFLSHQLAEGTELKTQRRVRVTLGFQPKICAGCRGLPAEPAPTAEIYGRGSKIRRFYWRELFFEETSRKADWDDANRQASDTERNAAHVAIKSQVLEEIKGQHASRPKYATSEPSQSAVLERYGVEVLSMEAEHIEAAQKGKVIRDGDEAISPEAFVVRRFAIEGWSALALESVPFHALFGVMMWLLVQDPSDQRCRMVGFGDRAVYEKRFRPPTIWTMLPDDFGCEGYGVRRKGAIKEHFRMLPDDREELLWLFDYWRPLSTTLRQYLWAHREPDVDRARQLIEVLPPNNIIAILRYLVADYWGHYLGWPDLLLYRNKEILFLEVKSSRDRLSQAQKGWVANNHGSLRLPFKLVKLHRLAQKSTPSTST